MDSLDSLGLRFELSLEQQATALSQQAGCGVDGSLGGDKLLTHLTPRPARKLVAKRMNLMTCESHGPLGQEIVNFVAKGPC